MVEKFKPTKGSKALWPTFSDAIVDAAFASANDFMDTGLGSREAGSLVAHAMIRAAYGVASSGAVLAGVEPDKDKFRAVVEEALADFDDGARDG